MAEQKVLGLTPNKPAPDDWVEIHKDDVEASTLVAPSAVPFWERLGWQQGPKPGAAAAGDDPVDEQSVVTTPQEQAAQAATPAQEQRADARRRTGATTTPEG